MARWVATTRRGSKGDSGGRAGVDGGLMETRQPHTGGNNGAPGGVVAAVGIVDKITKYRANSVVCAKSSHKDGSQCA